MAAPPPISSTSATSAWTGAFSQAASDWPLTLGYAAYHWIETMVDDQLRSQPMSNLLIAVVNGFSESVKQEYARLAFK